MPDKYAAERYVPKMPACRRALFSLRFNGATLFALSARRVIQFPAVSGRRVGSRFDYSVARQRMPGEGPIPAGRYWIQPSQMQENAWYRLGNPSHAWGDHWITIHPYPDTQTYSRGGFFIHGGAVPGSAGCIDLWTHMHRFVEALSGELNDGGACFIPLQVSYSI